MIKQFCAFFITGFLAVIMSCRVPNSHYRGMAGNLFAEPGHVIAYKPLGVPNFGQASHRLYRGGQPSKRGFEALAKMGIGVVVDLRGSRKGERKQVTSLGMQYVSIPWHCFRPRDKIFARFLTLLRENPDQKVFVHCRLGDDRTGMMIAAYRMAEQAWTAEKAMKEMEEYGFSGIHHLICPRLASYEKSFPRRLKSSPAFRGLHPSGNHTSSAPLSLFHEEFPYLLLPSSS